MSRTKRLTEIEKMQIVREAAEGVSTSELAERFEVTSRAVRYVLKADAERQADAAIPVSAVSVKVTAAELEALDAVLAKAGIESRAEGLRRLIQAAGGVFVPDAQMAADDGQVGGGQDPGAGRPVGRTHVHPPLRLDRPPGSSVRGSRQGPIR